MKAFIKENLKSILLMILAGFIMTLFVCSDCWKSFSLYWRIASLNASMWILLWLGNEYLGLWVDTKISWFESPVKRFFAGIISMTGYSVSIVYLLLKIYELAFDLVIMGESLEWTFYISIGVTFFISFFMHGRAFLVNWKEAKINAEKLEKENIAAKYESLKSQVNPHFLFNSLNALTNLVYEDQDMAVRFIKQLSEVYRYVLDSRNKELVSLEEEKKFLEAYLYLQHIRFGDKLKLNVELEGVKSMVAPLVLQMLVENAIKHNVISEENPLNIHLYVQDNFIVVENNLQQKSILPEDSPGIGLDNIQKRYEFLSDRKVEVAHDRMFVVKLPIIPQIL